MTTIRWVPTDLDPRKMIAVSTLDAVRTLLRAPLLAAPPLATTPDGGVIVRVGDLPPLHAVGGVVRVDDRACGPVGIARIGRTSFVAFRLAADGLRQVPVELDEAAGTLRVQAA